MLRHASSLKATGEISPPRREEHKHRHAQVGGLTFYPHLTGDGEVRLVFGRELSSPVGPLGALQHFKKMEKSFFVLPPGFFLGLLFILFCFSCCVHAGWYSEA